jgi:hypothetical protein
MIILAASSVLYSFVHAADRHEVTAPVEQSTLAATTAAVAAVVSPSRSHSTPPRPITPPVAGGQHYKKHDSYPGQGFHFGLHQVSEKNGKIVHHRLLAPLPEEFFRK